MNQRQLASVLFAVVGLVVALSRLPEIVIHLGALARWDPPIESPAGLLSQQALTMILLGSALLAVLVGVAVIVLRDRLANRLFPAGTEQLRAHDLQPVAFSVLGAYFVVHGISRIFWPGPISAMAAVQVALGIGLFFGAHALARLWSRARGFPEKPVEIADRTV